MNARIVESRTFTIKLGDMRMQLRLHDMLPTVMARLLASYRRFQETPGAPGADQRSEMLVEVAVEDGPPFTQPGAGEHTWHIETQHAGTRLWYKSYCEEGWLDLAAGAGQLTLRPQGQIENFLRLATARLALAHRGLLLHASGVIFHGRGYAFFGHSGAGKSTAAGFAPPGATVLSDDLVLLEPQTDGFWLYGLPFCGEALDAPRSSAGAPVAGLFALEQWPEHGLAPLPSPQAAAELLAAAPFVAGDTEALQQALAVCTNLAATCCIRRLRFAPDPGFWQLVTETTGDSYDATNNRAGDPSPGGGTPH
jgi:hypothetical protein